MRGLVVVASVGLSVVQLSPNDAYSKDRKMFVENKTEDCIRFQNSIRLRYENLNSNKLIDINGLGNDITDLLYEYVPPSTDFLYAENFLRMCSFKVSSRPGHTYENTNREDKYDVDASSTDYIIRPALWGMSVVVAVALRPISPDDYSIVKSATAYILVRAL